MKNTLGTIASLALCLCAVGCTEESLPNNRVKSCGELNPGEEDTFRSRTRDAAGSGAKDCGELEPYDDQTSTNQCLLDARADGLGAYAVYWRQGIDSKVGDSVAIEATGEVTVFSFDDYSCPSVSEERPCEVAEVDAGFTDQHGPFRCAL